MTIVCNNCLNTVMKTFTFFKIFIKSVDFLNHSVLRRILLLACSKMPISPEGCGFDWWRPIVCLPKWCGVGFSKLLSMLNKRSMGHLLSIWWHNPPGSWPELDSCSHRAPWHQVVTLSSICDFTGHYYIHSKYFLIREDDDNVPHFWLILNILHHLGSVMVSMY